MSKTFERKLKYVRCDNCGIACKNKKIDNGIEVFCSKKCRSEFIKAVLEVCKKK